MCVCVHLSCLFLVLADMGSGQVDDSVQSTDGQQQPSLNTTRLLDKYLPETDLVLHIGDISYANGYSSVVSSRAAAGSTYMARENRDT